MSKKRNRWVRLPRFFG